MAISTPMLVTFLVYIFGMILIGFLAWRSTKNFDDYILGGRSLGPLVTALSAGASDMSGWLLMGLPGAIFISGISESWIAIGLTLGAWLNWKLVAGRLRVHTEANNNALTLPDYFTGRFEDNSRLLRIISAVVILVFFTIYCASGIVAGARLFESTFGMSYETALWAGAAATILYTFVGGFLAVSWTDTVQASLMIFALILTPVIVIFTVGGFSDSLEVIKQKSIENVDMLKGLNFVAILSLMGWGLGYFGQPHILARFMAADSHHTIRACAPHQHDLDDPLPGGRGRRGLLRHRLLQQQPGAGGRGQPERRTRVHRAGARFCSTRGLPACCSPPSWPR